MLLSASNESWSLGDAVVLPLSVVALWVSGSFHWPDSPEKVTSDRSGPFRAQRRGRHEQKYI